MLNPRAVKTVDDAKKIVQERGLTHVKVGVFDTDGIMRGKYMSKEKFFSSLENGFGFCDVVLGWDCQDQLVDNLKSTVDRLSHMVDDLSVVSLLEAGRFDLHTERFDLDDLVKSAIEISEPAMAERGVSARMEEPGVAVGIDADRERTLQVLVNLLNNAAKYAEADTETIVTVSVTDSEVKVEIASRGPVIAEEDLGAVFESFYRSKSARTSTIPGSGLGLSIARGFVEAQGGKIWAESTFGEGNTFIFTLPLDKATG